MYPNIPDWWPEDIYQGEEEGEFLALPPYTIHSFDQNGDPIYYDDVK